VQGSYGPDTLASTCGSCGNRADPAVTLSGFRGGGGSAATQNHEFLDAYTKIPGAAPGHRRSDMYEMR